ncbi:hypothetical protein PCANB_001623 [Pneumocystis canis]|nr:hypothetical protein PCANB_001623 [Pneumocystis canis]
MTSDTSLQPCYIFFPGNNTQDNVSSEKIAHSLQKKHIYKSKNNNECATHFFPCLMHGREMNIARDYRYTCFRSLSNMLEKEANILFESIHSEVIHAIHKFISQNISLSDRDRIIAAIMLLNDAHFSSRYQLYSRIIILLEDNIHGPIITLHAQRAEDIKACFKQIIRTCLEFSEKIGLHNKTQLEKNIFTKYCEYDPECIVQWYEEAITYDHIDQDKFKMIIFLQEIESFPGDFINHFISVLKKLHERVPLLLLITVSTSIQIFQDLLEKKSLKALDIQYFNTKHFHDNMDIAVEKLLITSQRSKLRLGPHLYHTLLDLYKRHSYSIESFVSAIKYVIMSHFYSNPISIVNHCDSAHSELISHDHLECLRSLTSMKQYTESLLDAGDIHSVESLLNDDNYFRNVIDTLIHNMEKHNEKLNASVLLLNIIQRKYVSFSRRRTLTWIYGKFLKNDIHDLETILDPIKAMNLEDLLGFIQEALTYENIYIHFLDLETFYKKITDIIKSLAYNHSMPTIANEKNSSIFTETLNKIRLEGDIKAIETELSSIKKSLCQYFQGKLTEYLISPMALPLHELYYFNYTRTYLDVFHPRVRATIDTALSMPSHYLSCDCNNKNESENDNNTRDPSQSQICLSCQPKICISYRLFLESGSLINISNWLSAFIQSVNCEDKQSGNNQESEKLLQAEFLQSLEELRYLGFIKPTRKKTDHVAKITWMR